MLRGPAHPARVPRRRAPASLAICLALVAAPARARGPSEAQLAEEGLSDPRARALPTRHRLRVAIVADWVRASKACTPDLKRCQRFHFAPLLLDIAYQAQIFGRAMVRPSLGIGINVGNSRNAMPVILQPSLFAGYQGKLLGAALGYAFIFPFPATANNTDGHQGLAQPVLWKNHVIAVEASLTSRLDRVALQFALRVGGMHTELNHLNIEGRKRWYPILTFSAGVFFDLGQRKKRARVGLAEP